ncbi:type VII secretion-associated serine protease mycosin [Streptomyces sp. P38-E01]|uniref:Type VII secretion-associated serine protease mycosin n=1 Tax=Streptomyces tardus TaxID=2780544 RepID=A0A949JGY4_9ACTN|nr:type VII secretion-associated serine protease mycosin [Streptomyces tardus]MBU7596079.1 type VII secretion-associated serine protease mycosin [Streptomyces tardus]
MGHRATGQRAGRLRRSARTAVITLCVTGLFGAPVLPAQADEGPSAQDDNPGTVLNNGECDFPADPIAGTPWALQRLLFDQIWEETKGKGVEIAVIDSGTDNQHPQLKSAVSKGRDVITKKGDGTSDQAGHGTKVGGIIAARPAGGTGFVGIAPEATLFPIRQNDNEVKGTVKTMVQAIDAAISRKVDIINISQGTSAQLADDSPLHRAVARAQRANILVIASAGNDGASGEEKDNFPASIPGVLGVAASDRNNERAGFSQSGEAVDIAAPGVDIVSTVPGAGHCVDNGTSFAAPYVAGVAALVRAKYPKWDYKQVSWHLQETADRVSLNRDKNVGWGVVDPMAALGGDGEPPAGPPAPDKAENTGVNADNILPAPVVLGETPQERRVRYGLYIFTGGVLGVAVVVGTSIAIRDWRRKTSHNLHGEAING